MPWTLIQILMDQNPPRAHNNMAVVLVQEQLTSPEPEISDATDF